MLAASERTEGVYLAQWQIAVNPALPTALSILTIAEQFVLLFSWKLPASVPIPQVYVKLKLLKVAVCSP